MENIVGEIRSKQEEKMESLGPLKAEPGRHTKQDGSLLNQY